MYHIMTYVYCKITTISLVNFHHLIWAYLIAQLVKSASSADTLVRFLGQGRCAGEGIDYPLQYSWAFLVAQMPAMWATWIQSLSWKDPLEKGKATYSSILAWRILRTV